MLEVENLTVRFGSTLALDKVSLSAPAGEITSVLGANGAGKSTLFRTIMGLVPAVEGSIRHRGEAINGLPTHQLVKRGIILCPEGRRLFPEMTVADNVRMGAYLISDRDKINERLAFVHRLFPRVAERSQQLAASLSGGEQQMVAIARALMGKPQLLLLDEPTLGLAPKVIQEVLQTVQRICAEGISVILVEQNATQALKISNQAYVLETGRLAMAGTSSEILSDPRVREVYLGG